MKTAPKRKIKGKLNVLTQKLAAALDACKISDRNAVHIIAATAESLGYDISNIILNKESIRAARQILRSTRVAKLKSQFNVEDLDAVCLHWDGKLLPALEGKEKVERLPILISNGTIEQLLEVPALESGTGRAQALAICKSLFEWGLQDYVKALVFDTTAVNTGRFNGTCSIIENILEKNLLYFACRHHIFEIILKSVFDVKFVKSEGPNVQIFQRFQKCWPNLNAENFKIGIEDKKVRNAISLSEVERITNFLKKVLQEKQPRDDYKEFIELALIFLGESSIQQGVKFRAPGAMHHARWMSKALYTLKIFLFRDEFKLTNVEQNALCDISIFIIKVYIEAWFSATSPLKAPYHDFNFLTVLSQYQSVEPEIANAALKKFSSHLWYLGTENVALAFFDESVPLDTKSKIVKALKIETDVCNKKALIDTKNIADLNRKGIEQFVSSNTNKFFNCFGLCEKFLKTSPSKWKNNKNYNAAQKQLSGLKVVNDTAERGVKLMQDYNSILSRSEDQKQYILQIVKAIVYVFQIAIRIL